MKELTLDDFRGIWQHVLLRIKEREDEFSQLDAVIGDGDHGTAIVTALTSINNSAKNGTTFQAMLSDMGMGVMLEVSGSTSTLLGAFLLGMSDHSSGTSLDADGVRKMFAGGLDNVQKQTKAQVGDKTMMDALIPAVQAMETAETTDIRELFKAAAAAALQGAERTVSMKANFGRARNYGERSVGHADSGATSWACMFSAFAEAVS